jgi:hypothetical protein
MRLKAQWCLRCFFKCSHKTRHNDTVEIYAKYKCYSFLSERVLSSKKTRVNNKKRGGYYEKCYVKTVYFAFIVIVISAAVTGVVYAQSYDSNNLKIT